MSVEEIVRRLRALLALPARQRPISVDKLEKVAGIANNEVYPIAKNGKMQEKTRARLEYALKLVENDQLVIKNSHGAALFRKPGTIAVRAPQPPQVTVRRITFTEHGPRVRFEVVNPRAFPQFAPPTVKAYKPRHGR